MLCINMAKARYKKITLKDKINFIDASRITSQQQLAENLN